MVYRIFPWLLIFFACFYGLGGYPLQDNNEGMYASIARNMLTSGDFVIPHLNGLPYIEKPPMLYWLMAGSMSIFGVNAWAAHLIPALALFITSVMLVRFISTYTRCDSTGINTGLLMTTPIAVFFIARKIIFDMVMTCFLTAALIEFYHWYQHKDDRKKHLRRFYAFLALAILTKGFLAVILAGGTITAFLLWQRAPLKTYVSLLSPAGMLVFFAISAPWHILASLREPGFAWFYFINEHIYRFLDMREPHDYYTGPIWYYIPRLFFHLLPWTFFMFAFFKPVPESDDTSRDLRRFLWSWLLFCLCFFSIAGEKANYYMTAATPALTALLAIQLQPMLAGSERTLRSITCGSFVLVMMLLCISHFFCINHEHGLNAVCNNISWPLAYSVIFYALSGSILSWFVPQRSLVLLFAANILFFLPLKVEGFNIAADQLSQKPVADYLNYAGYSDIAYYQDFDDHSALAFYLPKPIFMVDSQSSDLKYGQDHVKDSPYFITLTQWSKRDPSIPMVVLKKNMFRTFDALRAIHVNIKHVCIEKQFEQTVVMHMCDLKW